VIKAHKDGTYCEFNQPMMMMMMMMMMMITVDGGG